MQFSDWSLLSQAGTRLAAVECHPFDKRGVLSELLTWARDAEGTGCSPKVPTIGTETAVYLHNPGYGNWQRVTSGSDTSGGARPTTATTPVLHATELMPDSTDPVQWLLDNPTPGIFVFEGMMPLTEQRRYQLLNAFEQARWSNVPCYWVFLAEQIDLPASIQGMLPVLSLSLPNYTEVEFQINVFCKNRGWTDTEGRLTRSAQGMSSGEIEWVLQREQTFVQSADELAVRVLAYKTSKLRGRGLEFIAKPDIPSAAGVDLLEQHLSRVMALLDPAAQRQGLSFPRGMLLWGPPGTGKSLSAKLAASKMGVPLVAADWNGLRGKDSTESLQNLRFLLDTCESMAPCVLYFDDFDKSFAGWDTDSTAKQSAQRLLTWMQEHTQPVYVMATVNRLGMLPIELQRRFRDVFFFDLPHDGARYRVFNLHLAKYFPAFREAEQTGRSPWTDEQWRELLTEYRLCIPDEIGNAVRRVAEEVFYQNRQDGMPDRPLELEFKRMLAQRQHFTPLMVREEGAMLQIRNNATYAQPVSSPDTSRFAQPQRELFGD